MVMWKIVIIELLLLLIFDFKSYPYEFGKMIFSSNLLGPQRCKFILLFRSY